MTRDLNGETPNYKIRILPLGLIEWSDEATKQLSLPQPDF